MVIITWADYHEINTRRDRKKDVKQLNKAVDYVARLTN